MMFVVLRSLSIFLMGLEILLLVYIFLSMFHVKLIKKIISNLVEPILLPIQMLMRHSVLHSPVFDISPIIAILVISYVEQILF